MSFANISFGTGLPPPPPPRLPSIGTGISLPSIGSTSSVPFAPFNIFNQPIVPPAFNIFDQPIIPSTFNLFGESINEPTSTPIRIQAPSVSPEAPTTTITTIFDSLSSLNFIPQLPTPTIFDGWPWPTSNFIPEVPEVPVTSLPVRLPQTTEPLPHTPLYVPVEPSLGRYIVAPNGPRGGSGQGRRTSSYVPVQNELESTWYTSQNILIGLVSIGGLYYLNQSQTRR